MNRSISSTHRKALALGYWHDRATRWLEASATDQAYGHLSFAFAFSQLGELSTTARLTQQARQTLEATGNQTHRLLMQCFRYRIYQSLLGKPHTGALAPELLEGRSTLDDLSQAVVDRFRFVSRILEPADAELEKTTQLDDPEASLNRLARASDPLQIQSTIEQLQSRWLGTSSSRKMQIRFYSSALRLLPLMKPDDASRLFRSAIQLIETLPEPQTDRGYQLCSGLLQQAIKGLTYLGEIEHLAILSGYHNALMHLPQAVSDPGLPTTLTVYWRLLRSLGQYEELERRQCQTLDWIRNQDATMSVRRLLLILSMTEAWLMLGKQMQAYPVLDEVREHLLYRADTLSTKNGERAQVACRYIDALAFASLDVINERIEEMLEQLERPTNTTIISMYFCLPALQIVEAIATCQLELNAPHCHVVQPARATTPITFWP